MQMRNISEYAWTRQMRLDNAQPGGEEPTRTGDGDLNRYDMSPPTRSGLNFRNVYPIPLF